MSELYDDAALCPYCGRRTGLPHGIGEPGSHAANVEAGTAFPPQWDVMASLSCGSCLSEWYETQAHEIARAWFAYGAHEQSLRQAPVAAAAAVPIPDTDVPAEIIVPVATIPGTPAVAPASLATSDTEAPVIAPDVVVVSESPPCIHHHRKPPGARASTMCRKVSAAAQLVVESIGDDMFSRFGSLIPYDTLYEGYSKTAAEEWGNIIDDYMVPRPESEWPQPSPPDPVRAVEQGDYDKDMRKRWSWLELD